MSELQYLNTDLDLASREDLGPLVAALEAGGIAPLTVWEADGQHRANLETDEQHDHPEPNIAAILGVVEAFDATARAHWDACTTRELNLGYEGGDTPGVLEQALPVELLRRVVAAGLGLRITVYAPPA